MTPRVMMYSLWRNDAERNLLERARHLIGKTYEGLRWVWVVGDSDDSTFDTLSDFADKSGFDIAVIEHRTGHRGTDHRSRLARLSASCNVALSQVSPADDYVVMHESDLISPKDLIEQFLATGKEYVAGSTWLTLHGKELFYDVWAFWRDGERFQNNPPYHPCWKPDELFRVDSFGSCCMLKAEPFMGPYGVRVYTDAVREMCGKLTRDHDAELWCASWIRIEQPAELWTPHQLSNKEMVLSEWK